MSFAGDVPASFAAGVLAESVFASHQAQGVFAHPFRAGFFDRKGVEDAQRSFEAQRNLLFGEAWYVETVVDGFYRGDFLGVGHL